MGSVWIVILVGMRVCATKFRRFALLRAMGPILVTVLGIGIMNATGWYSFLCVFRMLRLVLALLGGEGFGSSAPLGFLSLLSLLWS